MQNVAYEIEKITNELDVITKDEALDYDFSNFDIDTLETLQTYCEFSRDMYKLRQNAYKTTANALYGYLGTETARFYNPDISEAITAVGQEELESAYKKLTENNIFIIYGDTDSLFIKVELPENIDLDDFDLCKKYILDTYIPKLYEILNKELDDVAERIGCKDHRFLFKQEIIARSGIFIPKRDITKEAKKRYALWVIDEEGVPVNKIVSRGIELRQSKYPEIVKKYLEDFISILLKSYDENSKEQLIEMIKELKRIIIKACDEWDIEKIAFRVKFNKPLNEFESTKKDALFAQYWNKFFAKKYKLPEIYSGEKLAQVSVKLKDLTTIEKYDKNILYFYKYVKDNNIRTIVIPNGKFEDWEIIRKIFIIDKEQMVDKLVRKVFTPYLAVIDLSINVIDVNILNYLEYI